MTDLLRDSSVVLRARNEDALEAHVDDSFRQPFKNQSASVFRFFSALYQLFDVIEDMITCRQMLKRYPWHAVEITRSKHLEMNWFLFQNLCYRFKEKVKLFFNCQKEVTHWVGLEPPTWLKSELKVVQTSMGNLIADRGNHVHGWDVKQREIDFLNMVELYASFHEQGVDLDLPEGFRDIRGHYFDTKLALNQDVNEQLDVASALFERVVKFHAPRPREVILKFGKIIDAINKGDAVLSPLQDMKRS